MNNLQSKFYENMNVNHISTQVDKKPTQIDTIVHALIGLVHRQVQECAPRAPSGSTQQQCLLLHPRSHYDVNISLHVTVFKMVDIHVLVGRKK